MGEVVNLRSVRKRKAREDKERAAAENRVLFGRSAIERRNFEAERRRLDEHLDGHRRDEEA